MLVTSGPGIRAPGHWAPFNAQPSTRASEREALVVSMRSLSLSAAFFRQQLQSRTRKLHNNCPGGQASVAVALGRG